MKTRPSSRVPAVTPSVQRPLFDSTGRRLPEPARILDNFVPPKHTGPERKPLAVQKNKAVEALAKKFTLWTEIVAIAGARFDDDEGEGRYRLISEFVKGMAVPNGAVEALVPQLQQLCPNHYDDSENAFKRSAGIFLSVLMNKSKQQEFTFSTHQWDDPIGQIGMNNCKIITLHGPGGPELGYQMTTGRIVVNGDVDYCLGREMSGGHIIVNGNSDGSIGDGMSGGTIEIFGNVDLTVNTSGPFGNLNRGTIIVHDHIYSTRFLYGKLGQANIYQVLNGNKRQLVKDGQPINEPRD